MRTECLARRVGREEPIGLSSQPRIERPFQYRAIVRSAAKVAARSDLLCVERVESERRMPPPGASRSGSTVLASTSRCSIL